MKNRISRLIKIKKTQIKKQKNNYNSNRFLKKIVKMSMKRAFKIKRKFIKKILLIYNRLKLNL